MLLNTTGLSTRTPRLSAWTWSAEEYTPLDTPFEHASFGVALNADGTVLSYIEPRSGPRVVSLWRHGMLADLNIPTEQKFRPRAFFDALVAVGGALTEEGRRSACRWSFEHSLKFLSALHPNEPDLELNDAVSINNHGQMLASARQGSLDTAVLLNSSA